MHSDFTRAKIQFGSDISNRIGIQSYSFAICAATGFLNQWLVVCNGYLESTTTRILTNIPTNTKTIERQSTGGMGT